jgi:hypothetical protein
MGHESPQLNPAHPHPKRSATKTPSYELKPETKPLSFLFLHPGNFFFNNSFN